MFNEQIEKYRKVMGHVLTSSAIWLIVGIATLDAVWTNWISDGQAEWISLIALLLTFYIGTGVCYCFAHGEFRVTTSQAYKSAGPVILPIFLFSIKLSLLWMIPFIFAIVAIVISGDNQFFMILISITIFSLMFVSIIFGTAIVFINDDYRMWHTVKLMLNNLAQLLHRTLLPMAICITLLALSFPLTFNENMQPWLIITTPFVELTEYALFLYVVGVLASEPDYLQLPDTENS